MAKAKTRRPSRTQQITITFETAVPKELKKPLRLPYVPRRGAWYEPSEESIAEGEAKLARCASERANRFSKATRLFGLSQRDLRAGGEHVARKILERVFDGLCFEKAADPSPKRASQDEVRHPKTRALYAEALRLRASEPGLNPRAAWLRVNPKMEIGAARNRWSRLQHDPVVRYFEKLFLQNPDLAASQFAASPLDPMKSLRWIDIP
jgi:hypothetical protein